MMQTFYVYSAIDISLYSPSLKWSPCISYEVETLNLWKNRVPLLPFPFSPLFFILSHFFSIIRRSEFFITAVFFLLREAGASAHILDAIIQRLQMIFSCFFVVITGVIYSSYLLYIIRYHKVYALRR